MKRSVLIVALTMAVSGTASAQKIAVPIPILNPGFEDDVLTCAAGYSCDENLITGWVCGPGTGTFKPGVAEYPNGIPGGTNVAFFGGSFGTGSIMQTLGVALQANTTYLLTFSVGARADLPFTGYVAALMAGNVVLVSDNRLNPAAGTWLEDVMVFKSGPTPLLLGQALQILIKSVGTGQVNIDNVSLTAVQQ